MLVVLAEGARLVKPNVEVDGIIQSPDRQLEQYKNLELLAAFFTMKVFCKGKSGIHVLMRLDNTTTVSYINAMGGIKSV